MNSKQGSPFVLAPVQTIAEEMVRISELRRDNPKLAQKIMMQGSMLVDLATNGKETNDFINRNRKYLHGSFAKFYPSLPTGRYILDMNVVSDRSLLKRLMEISNDERASELKAKIKDQKQAIAQKN